MQQKKLSLFSNNTRKIISIYGFCPNPRLSAKTNACRLAIKLPTTFQMKRPKNMAYHNLCKNIKVPSFVRNLLGLGLKFCPNPKKSSAPTDISLQRLSDDYHRFIFFNSSTQNEYEKPPLYINKEWVPTIPNKYEQRLEKFQDRVTNHFTRVKKCQSNLTLQQERAMKWLKDNPNIIVFNADKNLGPITMDRDEYIFLAHRDHLRNTTAYKRLTTEEKSSCILNVMTKIDTFCDIWHHKKWLSENDMMYIKQNTSTNPSWFYLLAKIHKTPLKTRPIISYSGSACYGLAKWLDVELQKMLPFLPYIATSSREIVSELKELELPDSARLITMDATAMYTNIHLEHAKEELSKFLLEDDLGKSITTSAGVCPAMLIHALEIVMTNNIFAFGDTFWLQQTGTAMGTPPAPPWATIYFCIHEYRIIDKFPELHYYRRYIDDGFGIWIPQDDSPNIRLDEFKMTMASYGIDHPFFARTGLQPLQWEFSSLDTSAIFLDLDISIKNRKIATKIYEKDLNLYLYIPPHSCHSKGVLKGLISGMVYRAKCLCTDTTDIVPFLVKCHQRLLDRGYQDEDIRPLFKEAISTYFGPNQLDIPTIEKTRPIFLHVNVNPADPPSSYFQELFSQELATQATNPEETPSDDKSEYSVTCDRMTVCYHGAKNLKSILSPRKGRFGKNFSVASSLAKLEETANL